MADQKPLSDDDIKRLADNLVLRYKYKLTWAVIAFVVANGASLLTWVPALVAPIVSQRLHDDLVGLEREITKRIDADGERVRTSLADMARDMAVSGERARALGEKVRSLSDDIVKIDTFKIEKVRDLVDALKGNETLVDTLKRLESGLYAIANAAGGDLMKTCEFEYVGHWRNLTFVPRNAKRSLCEGMLIKLSSTENALTNPDYRVRLGCFRTNSGGVTDNAYFSSTWSDYDKLVRECGHIWD